MQKVSFLPTLEWRFGTSSCCKCIISAIPSRFILCSSIKVKETGTGKRSISHFYRDCEVWPRLNPSVVLATASSPINATASKTLLLGGTDNKVTLTACLHRLHWIAGQQCSIRLFISNHSKKTIRTLTLALIRTTVLFKPRVQLDQESSANLENDPDACQTSTVHKQVAESILQMADGSTRGHASAKGWFTGVPPSKTLEFRHFLQLPVRNPCPGIESDSFFTARCIVCRPISAARGSLHSTSHRKHWLVCTWCRGSGSDQNHQLFVCRSASIAAFSAPRASFTI